MTGPELLKFYEDNWETTFGACFPGEQRIVVRGVDLFDSFKQSGWMEYLLFVVTGKRDKKLANLLESIWVYCTSFPDPRLWNNRVASLAATTRSTAALGVSAGVAVSEATLYGLKPIKGVSDFLLRVQEKLDQGIGLDLIIEKEMSLNRSIYGYGRPITENDERIPPVLKMIKNNGYFGGNYLSLAFEIEKKLQKKYKVQMNIAAVYGALLCDQKFTPMEAYYMATLSFSAGMFGAYIDALDKPSGAFFPIHTCRINYKGVAKSRVWE
ncbi:MAG: hypothetical protein QNK31_14080 [Porticoccus sp.]|nr:hypothetical protein [Porticoccus sp.]